MARTSETSVAATVTRAQVLAHRVRATGLDRPSGAAGGHGRRGPAGPPYLDLGVQDTPPGAHRLHLANRLGEPLDPEVFEAGSGDQPVLSMAWSMRGTPHVHRSGDLAARAAAIWPLSDDDALNRMGSGLVKQIRSAELRPIDAYTITAEAMAAAVPAGEQMTKGELSGLVTAAIPDELSTFCRGCDVVHVGESLFRGSALLAGLRIVPGEAKLSFEHIPGWRHSSPDPAATVELAVAYLGLLGPGTQGEAAEWVGTTKADLAARWPEGLVQVEADGRRTWFPEDDLDDLLDAPRPGLVRFLGPFDPYLQGRDRPLLVPDPEHRKQVWKILGNPGAVVVDGEVVGTWRAKAKGKRAVLTVTPLKRITKAARATLAEEEAPLVAAVRGAEQAEVAYE